MQRTRRLAWYFAGLTALTYVLVVFGAVVRAKGAGLACPDWPLCFGDVVPSLDFGVILEFGHRALAGVVSLLLVLGAVLVAIDPLARQHVKRHLVISFVVLIVQIILGGLTVLHLLASWTVTSHLLCGNAFALSVGIIAAVLFRISAPARYVAPTSSSTRVAVAATCALLVAQLALGGLVSSNWAGLACVEWPACVGTIWFPAFTGPVGLHVIHRLLAYALIIAFSLVMWLSWHQDRLGRLSRIAMVLVLVQVSLGISNVLLRLPLEVTAAHSAFAALLVLTTGLMVHDAFTRPLGPHADTQLATEAA